MELVNWWSWLAPLIPLDVAVLGVGALGLVVLAWRVTPRSPQRRRIMLYTGGLVAAIVLIGGWFVNDAGRLAQERLRGTVAGYAPTYAIELTRMGHAELSDDCAADDPRYLAMIAAQKRWLSANPSIADIYTFRRAAGGGSMLLVDSETDYDRDGAFTGEREARTAVGERYDDQTPEVAAAFAGIAGFVDTPRTDRWGTWVSALHPMYDGRGRVEAVLGVDFDAGRWVALVAGARWTAIGYVAMLILMMVAGVSVYEVLACSLERARRAEATAAAAARVKGDMLANLSHEIRTPMTAIMGYADLLLDTTQSAEQRRACVETIRRNGEHLLGMLNDLLDASKMEAGKLGVEVAWTDGVRICHEAVEMLRLRAQERGIGLRLARRTALPERIETDPLRLKQVVLNLVANAIKFTERGGVMVEMRLVQSEDVGPDGGGAGRGEGALFEVSVSDSGIGISPEQASRLFRPFEQADASTTRKYGGTGLGLSISKHLAEQLGGRITVRSTPGVGSTFTVRVAAGDLRGVRMVEAAAAAETQSVETAAADAVPERGEQRAVERRASGESGGGGGEATLAGVRVLVADDGVDNRRLLQRVLTSAGAAVVLVENGAEAVRAVGAAAEREEPFDVVLMDMQMPELDGYGAARKLRDAGHGLAIVALTADATTEVLSRAAAAGCDDTLSKPINRPRLIAAVRSWADEQRCREAGGTEPEGEACSAAWGRVADGTRTRDPENHNLVL